jgi:uncharacterized protein (TIGR03083 family)
VVSERHELSDAEVEALLGAFALDACEPGEAAAVEMVLARRPDLAREADRLSRAATWIGASEATEPPARLRADVLTAATARRSVSADPVVDLYVAFAERMGRAIDELPAAALDVVTTNGLTAHDLVVHMAAQESLLAQSLGVPTIDDLDEEEIVARTHALLPRFHDRDLADAVDLWRDSVEANRAWAVANPDRTAIWRGLGLTRDDTLLVRSFEAWIHSDDLRRAAGVPATPPVPSQLSLMSDLAGRILPLSLAVAGREHDAKTARLVLTGDGGGDWTIAMGAGEASPSPDVTVTADVIEWCMLVGDRIDPTAMHLLIDGDPELGRDLVASASSLATL